MQPSPASTSTSAATSSSSGFSRSNSSSGSTIAASTPATTSSSAFTMNGNGKERERTSSSGLTEQLQNDAGSLGQSMASLDVTGNGRDGLNDGTEDDRGLLEYTYQRGFINGEFNDVQLHYRHDKPPLKLHSLIISQSPALEKELSYSQSPQHPLNILFSLQGHEEITDEAFQLSISYLYSSRAFGHVNTSNAPAVLSAAALLQLPKLADYAFKLCKESIANLVSPNEVKYWIVYLERLAGKTTTTNAGKGKEAGYAQELQEDLLHRLTTSLPLSLHAFSSTTPSSQQVSSQSILQSVYSVLPFPMFKTILESPSLKNEEGESLSDQTRFGLAKKCILQRKKLQLSSNAAEGGERAGEREEESVVLAFGAGTGTSNVQIVRKPKQTRKLWKVNG